MGYTKREKPLIPRKSGYKASRVFEALHVDVTFVQTLNEGVQKVAFVKDNFSTALLHYGTTSGSADSEFIKSILEETFVRYKLHDRAEDVTIISDGGSENKGEVLKWIGNLVAPPIVNKITAKSPDFPFSNNMSESTHRIYKSEFMQSKISADKAAHKKDLDRFVNYYNNARFPSLHFGLSPMEVLKGKCIDRHLFSDKIAEAKFTRLEINRNFNQCVALQGCNAFN